MKTSFLLRQHIVDAQNEVIYMTAIRAVYYAARHCSTQGDSVKVRLYGYRRTFAQH